MTTTTHDMNWTAVFDDLDRTLSTERKEPSGALVAEGEPPAVDDVLGRHAGEDEDSTFALDGGLEALREAFDLRPVVVFDWPGMEGAIVLLHLNAGERGRYAVLHEGVVPDRVIARLEESTAAGTLLRHLVATNGTAYDTELFGGLPEVIYNAAPDLVTETDVRAGFEALLQSAKDGEYDPMESLDLDGPVPETKKERDAVFTSYWQETYTEERPSRLPGAAI